MTENGPDELSKIPAKRRPWRHSLVLGFVILLCGAAIGSVVTALVIEERPARGRRTERLPEQIAEKMQRKYNLTDDQTKQILTVFQEHWKKLTEIRAEVQPRVEAEHEALRATVENILTPEQAAQWRKEFEQMRRPWHHSGGDSPSSDDRR
jgi:Spy/CpxP family protein refolding chaperone